MTTHAEKIVNSLKKRVLTLKDGRLVNDQDHGRYTTEARKVFVQPGAQEKKKPEAKAQEKTAKANTGAVRRARERE